MNKKFLQTSIALLLVLPLYTYAEDVSATAPKEEALGVLTVKTFTECSQDAIEKRDTQIASSRSVYNIAMTTALGDRKNKEKGAVAEKDQDNKKEALKSSVETYKALAKQAQQALTLARKNAWQTFENDIKKCRDIKTEEDVTQEKETQTTPSQDGTRKNEDTEVKETKTIKETIKAQFETFKSFFN